MNMREFSAAYNQAVRGGVQKITSFGSAGDDDVGVSSASSDFESDFNEDFSSSAGVQNFFDGDFSDDFADALDGLSSSRVVQKEDCGDGSTKVMEAFGSSDTVEKIKEDSGDNGGENVISASSIESVFINTVHKDDNDTILSEIREFLEMHRQPVGQVEDEMLYKHWSKLYNVALNSNDKMIEMYYKVHYCLWFTKAKAMELMNNSSRAFREAFVMSRRACTDLDVESILFVWQEEWFDFGVIDRYANDENVTKLLIRLMEEGKCNDEILDRYVDNTSVLIACIRLLLEDNFVLGQFEAAVQENAVEEYTNGVTNSNMDRFEKIRNRSDFPELYKLITAAENSGKLISQEVIDGFCDAVYLRAILTAEAESRLNVQFAREYLVSDLGVYSFVAAIYESGNIDLSLDTTSVLRSKLLTDVHSLQLDSSNFGEEYMAGIQCLVCSRFAGKLSEIDYRKFLALCSFSKGKTVLEMLSGRKHMVSSYNVFWFKYLLVQLNLNLVGELKDDIYDNILYVQKVGNGRRKFYLQIDDFVLNPAEFKHLFADAVVVSLLENNYGLFVSNSTDVGTVNYNDRFAIDGSLSAWAKGYAQADLLQQFKQYNPIIHTNFLLAMSKANLRFSVDRQENSGSQSLNRTVLDVLKMDISSYYSYDKMFAFLAGQRMYLGLFSSKYNVDLFKLFSNTYVYDSNPKIMFTFLYSIFRKFCPDKLKVDSKGFNKLDSEKNILFVRGLGPNVACMNFRTIIDSIDNLIGTALASKQIILSVKDSTVDVVL